MLEANMAFEPEDLVELKNVSKVTKCIDELANLVSFGPLKSDIGRNLMAVDKARLLFINDCASPLPILRF